MSCLAPTRTHTLAWRHTPSARQQHNADACFAQLPPIESFKPLYSLEAHATSQSGWMYRVAVGVVLFASVYWVYVQPNAYHAQMLDEQRSFVDDLYSGE
jgi:hypothetical protein